MIMSFLLRRVLNPKLLSQPSTFVPLWLRVRNLSNEAVKWSDENLKEAIKKDKIVVFMKGIPTQPMCGFSNAVIQILHMHGVEDYASYNVLDDEELRQKIKEFSNWPTIPQVYMDGKLLGGCDIMIEMHREGDFIEELKKVGIKSALLEAEEEGGGNKDNS